MTVFLNNLKPEIFEEEFITGTVIRQQRAIFRVITNRYHYTLSLQKIYNRNNVQLLIETQMPLKSVHVFTDIDEKRLEMAKAVGADYTVLVKSRDGQEVARQIEEVMGQKPEITIECSGAPPSIQTAIYVCSVLDLTFSFFS